MEANGRKVSKAYRDDHSPEKKKLHEVHTAYKQDTASQV